MPKDIGPVKEWSRKCRDEMPAIIMPKMAPKYAWLDQF
jgi:hypothetical protein